MKGRTLLSALVTGASRGIGLAIVRKLLARNDVGTVFGVCRSPDRNQALGALRRLHGAALRTVAADLTREKDIAEMGALLERESTGLGWLINTAGVLHEGEAQPEKRLEQVDAAGLHAAFAVNAFAPVLMVKHMLPLLSHGERAVVVNLSARVGSIGDNRLGGWYGYRASKAAQNMLTKNLAIELKRRAPQVICAAVHPGTVDTDLSRPFQGNVPEHKLFSPERAATQILDIVDSLEPAESGRFFAWNREPIPW